MFQIGWKVFYLRFVSLYVVDIEGFWWKFLNLDIALRECCKKPPDVPWFIFGSRVEKLERFFQQIYVEARESNVLFPFWSGVHLKLFYGKIKDQIYKIFYKYIFYEDLFEIVCFVWLKGFRYYLYYTIFQIFWFFLTFWLSLFIGIRIAFVFVFGMSLVNEWIFGLFLYLSQLQRITKESKFSFLLTAKVLASFIYIFSL